MKTTKKSSKTSKRVFVRTTGGEKLQLTKTKLKQTVSSGLQCYATFVNLRKAVHSWTGLTVNFADNNKAIDVSFYPKHGGIGCCKFDEKTFNKIMKAAGSLVRFGQPVAPIV